MTEKSQPRTGGRLAALGWAVFLAVSWTWCIGMFLPVLLVRDFGFAGWVAFAAPNVIGAAAMGWVLQRADSAVQIAQTHRAAVLSFSLVTIAFHAFFASWIIQSLVNVGAVLLLLAVVLLWLALRTWRNDLHVAAVIFVLSLAAFVFVATVHTRYIPRGPERLLPSIGLVGLAPVCLLGFALCPYLDATFLRARAHTSSLATIAAFTLGFGVFFLVMILFTLWYARLVQPGRFILLARPIAWAIALHMILQSAFTIVVHGRAIVDGARGGPERAALSLTGGVLLFIAALWALRFTPPGFRATSGEFIYRLFLSFYGLVFPAYVWLCMIPSRNGTAGATRARLRVLAITVLIAAPFYWLGFAMDQMPWVAVGVAVVLIARFIPSHAGLISTTSPGDRDEGMAA